MMITNIFLLICAGVFVYIRFIQKDDMMATAMKLGAFYPPAIVEDHQYWRFITCHFIHVEIFHFLMNAYAFYQLGMLYYENGDLENAKKTFYGMRSEVPDSMYNNSKVKEILSK